MAMSTHTPGPWKWFDYPDGRKLLSGRNRAVIHCPDAPIGIDEPDMNLIAAATDLLEALKALVDKTERCDNPSDEGVSSDDECMVTARAAIAKAEQEPT